MAGDAADTKAAFVALAERIRGYEGVADRLLERILAEALFFLDEPKKAGPLVDRWTFSARELPGEAAAEVLCHFATSLARAGQTESATTLLQEVREVPAGTDPTRAAFRHVLVAETLAALGRDADALHELRSSLDGSVLGALGTADRLHHLVGAGLGFLELGDYEGAQSVARHALALEPAVPELDELDASEVTRLAARAGLAEEVVARLDAGRVAASDVGRVAGALASAAPDRVDGLRARIDERAPPERAAQLLSLAAGLAGAEGQRDAARMIFEEAVARIADASASARWRLLAEASDALVRRFEDLAGGQRFAREALEALQSLHPTGEERAWSLGAATRALVNAGELDRAREPLEEVIAFWLPRSTKALAAPAEICRDAGAVLRGGPGARRVAW